MKYLLQEVLHASSTSKRNVNDRNKQVSTNIYYAVTPPFLDSSTLSPFVIIFILKLLITINKLLNYSQLYFHAWALVKRARVSFAYSLKIIRLFYIKLPQATKDHLSQVIGRNDIGINILQKRDPMVYKKLAIHMSSTLRTFPAAVNMLRNKIIS